MKGPALQLYTDLPEEKKCSYVELVSALQDRFNPHGQAELFRAKLKVRVRRKGETLPELASEIRRLVSKAFPTASVDFREEIGRDYFLDALDSPDVRLQVRRLKPKTLAEALKLASEEDTFLQLECHDENLRRVVYVASTKSETNPKHSNDTEQLQDKINQLEKQVSSLQAQIKIHIGQKQRKPLVCWLCNQPGHRRIDCPFKVPREQTVSDNMAPKTEQENTPRLSMGPVPSQ